MPFMKGMEKCLVSFMRSPYLEAVLTGKAPMTKEMADIAGSVFGTGAAPWLMMIEACQ